MRFDRDIILGYVDQFTPLAISYGTKAYESKEEGSEAELDELYDAVDGELLHADITENEYIVMMEIIEQKFYSQATGIAIEINVEDYL